MTTEAEAVAAIVRSERTEPFVLDADDRRFLILHGQTAQELKPLDGERPTPFHIEQRVTLQDRASRLLAEVRLRFTEGLGVEDIAVLISYLGAFALPSTRILLDIERSVATAVIDYHQKDEAGHLLHVASWPLQFAEEWKRWTGASGKMTAQFEFARFLEENAAEVVAPSGADLLSIARDLQAVRKADFKQAVRLDNFDTAFQYVEETTAKSKSGAIEVPTRFKLSLPVYYGEPAVEAYAFLRWKISDGGLTLGYELHRAEFIRQSILRQIAVELADQTGVPVHLGRMGGQ